MRRFRGLSLMIAFVLGLAACSGGGRGAAGNNAGAVAENGAGMSGTAAGSENAAGPAFAGPAPVPGVARDFLIGSWATDSCDVPSAVYAANGTTDGGRRRWALEGDRLIVTRGAAREQSVVERLGDDRMRLNTADGPFELHRCPAARPQRPG